MVRFAHEALLSHSPLAREIIAANREFLATRSRVRADARRWLAEDKNPEDPAQNESRGLANRVKKGALAKRCDGVAGVVHVALVPRQFPTTAIFPGWGLRSGLCLQTQNERFYSPARKNGRSSIACFLCTCEPEEPQGRSQSLPKKKGIANHATSLFASASSRLRLPRHDGAHAPAQASARCPGEQHHGPIPYSLWRPDVS